MLRLRTYILIIIFIGFLLYAKGLFNGFLGDDDLQIVRNLNVHSLSRIPDMFLGSTYETAGSDIITGLYYRPLMLVVFSLIYAISGPNPFAFHLVQLVFHITDCVLLFIFFRKFFKDPDSFLLSLVFLVHPGNTEAVLYSANLEDVLFFFFGILSLTLFAYNKAPTPLVSIGILLSLFAKESGLVFMPVLLLYAYLFSGRKQVYKTLSFQFALVLGVYLFFRFKLAHLYLANSSLAPIATATLPERLMTIPAIIWYYLRLFFYPVRLGVDQFWVIAKISLQGFLMPIVIDCAFFALLFIFYLALRKHKTKYAKIYLFFAAWFLCGLVPYLQLIPLDSTVADRWAYFSLVGLLGMLGALTADYFPGFDKRVKVTGYVVILCVIIFFCLRSFNRISDWQTSLTLYRHDSSEQSNFILENAYASALIGAGDYTSAQIAAEKSVSLQAYSANLNNLAIAYTGEKKYAYANKYFIQALGHGENFTVYENYANFLLFYISVNKAQTFSKNALLLFPDSPRLWLTLAQAQYQTGDYKDAIKNATHSLVLENSNQTRSILTAMRFGKKLSRQEK